MQTDAADESEAALSDYERERGKPLPDIFHSVVQTAVATGLAAGEGDRYMVAMELTLEFPDGFVITPDIAVLTKRPINWRHEPARCRDLPLMVVEIPSLLWGYEIMVARTDAYFAHGVQSVWQVDLATQSIRIHHPGEQRPTIIQQGEAKDPATGLSVWLEDVFAS